MRTIVIGDVHGCLEELDELLRLLDLGTGDRLLFLGDLVDRGPDSIGVIRRVNELRDKFPGSNSICGNHEETALRFHDQGLPRPNNKGAWARDASSDDWAFLDSLPLMIRVEEFGLLLVHGGLYPRWFEEYGELAAPSPAWRKAEGVRADSLRRVLRVRKIGMDGNMLTPDTTATAQGARDWASWYDGREGFVYFGHQPQLKPPQPRRAKHALGLDTACCFGGRLTAAIVEPGGDVAAPSLVSVDARARYAERRFDDE